MKLPDFKYENEALNKGFRTVAGLDEVGRGAFAGSVVTGCVIFDKNTIYNVQGESLHIQIKIDDSKKLSIRQREVADKWIRENCLAYGIGMASVSQINKLGIKKATEIAFRMAITEANKILRYKDTEILEKTNKESLISEYPSIQYLLVDAFNIPRLSGLPRHKQNAIVKGDSLSISIAAASIIAKVYRDGLMTELSKKPKYTKYNWHKNKGYGTLEHREAINKHGITKLHRKTFVNTWISKLT